MSPAFTSDRKEPRRGTSGLIVVRSGLIQLAVPPACLGRAMALQITEALDGQLTLIPHAEFS